MRKMVQRWFGSPCKATPMTGVPFALPPAARPAQSRTCASGDGMRTLLQVHDGAPVRVLDYVH